MIPLIITMDLEIAHDHDITDQKNQLSKLLNDLGSINLPVTIFATSDAITLFKSCFTDYFYMHNEIGCHGLNHLAEENYTILPKNEIDKKISLATKTIEQIINKKILSFRGPRMSTSFHTQETLISHGYKIDMSVCSQRLDFFNCKGADFRWLFSPRVPYKPSKGNPFKKGNLPLLVIPLSCMGLPFISGILYLFGLPFMKLFFNLLLIEATILNKPIVYLFHSYEFSQYINAPFKHKNSLNNMNAKQPFYQKLYLRNRKKRYEINLNLLKYMLSFKNIRPMTSQQYLFTLGEK